MSIKQLAQRPLSLFGLGQQQPGSSFPPPKPVQSKGTPVGQNPFQQARLSTQPQQSPDQLGLFTNLMQSGAINPNLNKPALPHTATKSWSA